jgi:hypothetical protein
MLPQARGAINRNAQAAAVNLAALVGFCPPHRRNVNVAHAAVAAPLDATSGRRSMRQPHSLRARFRTR